MTSTTRIAALLCLPIALASCAGEQSSAGEGEVEIAEAPAQTEGMQGMPGMSGMDSMPSMAGMSGMGGMMSEEMQQMQVHMQEMQGASGQRMTAMLPQHRQMVADMLAQFNREMRDMSMATDEEWDATVDALREDLRRMPEMTAEELQALMPEHHQRVTRLMEMHRTMMSNMRM